MISPTLVLATGEAQASWLTGPLEAAGFTVTRLAPEEASSARDPGHPRSRGLQRFGVTFADARQKQLELIDAELVREIGPAFAGIYAGPQMNGPEAAMRSVAAALALVSLAPPDRTVPIFKSVLQHVRAASLEPDSQEWERIEQTIEATIADPANRHRYLTAAHTLTLAAMMSRTDADALLDLRAAFTNPGSQA